MKRNRLIVIGVLALAVAAWVTGGMYRSLKRAMGEVTSSTVPVVVMANEVTTGRTLAEEDLRLVNLPLSDLPAGTFRDKADVVGRGAMSPMVRNEPVLESKLAAKDVGGGLPAMIPSGKRAVSVKVNDVVSVAGFVAPGTRVDVLATGNPDSNHDPENVSTTTVLQNIAVLAAGTKLERNTQGQSQSVPVITLLVSPEEAQKLTLASSEGRIQLSLRNPLDAELNQPPVLRNGMLYRNGVEPAPAAPKAQKRHVTVAAIPPSPYVVETIRGEKRDAAKFTEE
ncbi:MAG: Flp pilus assembly protein CpaB [Candidatus Korobacteraceae bacterium]